MDPHSFNADPDPVFFFNADPDPDPDQGFLTHNTLFKQKQIEEKQINKISRAVLKYFIDKISTIFNA